MAPTSTLRADALPHVPPATCSRSQANHEHVNLNKLGDSAPTSNEYWSSRVLPSIVFPHHYRACVAISSNGLSPFGPHISTDRNNIWTRHGIDHCPAEFVADSWAPAGSPHRWQSNKFAPHTQRRQTNEGEHGIRSTGKDLLRSDPDGGWSELEATLTSVLNSSQFHVNAPEAVVMDSSGRREITRDALVNEMMRFSRVLRLETFTDIFKVNTFDRMVEFIHCLMTFCSIQSDPVFGYMVIPKGHLYVPARKMTISPRASLHPLGFASSNIPKRLFPPLLAHRKPALTKQCDLPPPLLAINISNTRIQRRVGPVKRWSAAIGAISNKENIAPALPVGRDCRTSDRPWRVDTPLPPRKRLFRAEFSDYGKKRENLQSRVRAGVKFDTFRKGNALYAN
jgi:hypothetical protein